MTLSLAVIAAAVVAAEPPKHHLEGVFQVVSATENGKTFVFSDELKKQLPNCVVVRLLWIFTEGNLKVGMQSLCKADAPNVWDECEIKAEVDATWKGKTLKVPSHVRAEAKSTAFTFKTAKGRSTLDGDSHNCSVSLGKGDYELVNESGQISFLKDKGRFDLVRVEEDLDEMKELQAATK